MVLIDVVSSAGITSYLFNAEEDMRSAINQALSLHLSECKVTGKVAKITRV